MSNLDGASHDEFYKSLLGDFLGESEHLLVSLNENLLQLDKWARSSKDTRRQQDMYHLIGELFRSAHSLKGLSNMLGLEEIERLIDSIEKVFDAARKDKIAVTGDVVKLMFEAIDRLGNLIDTLKDPDVPAVELVSIQERLAQLLTAAGTEPESSRAQGAEYTLGKIESQIQSILGGMESSHVSEASKSKPSTKPASMMSGSGEEQDAGGDKSESTAPGGVVAVESCLMN